MASYILLMRPLTSLSAAAAAYVGAVIAGSIFVPEKSILLALLSVFLITSGGMAVNDIVDAKIDAANNPKRPIPSGKISKSKATAWAVLLLVTGNFVSLYFLSMDVFYVTIVITIIFLAYNIIAKRIPLIGEIMASLLVVLAVFFGGFVQGNYTKAIPVMSIALLSSISHELYKRLFYTIGEKHQMYATIATKLGVIKAKMLANIFIVVTVIASFAIFFINAYSTVYLFFAIVADIIFIAVIVTPLRFSSKLIKIGIILVFIAFLADAYNARYLVIG